MTGLIGARLKRLFRLAHGLLAMRIGRIATNRPLSTNWGFDRGLPIDRFYIEHFLNSHAQDVGGRVLEIAEDLYASRFGRGRISNLAILSLDPSPKATIVGDLTDTATLPAARFDCIIATQTLQLIFDVKSAIQNLHRALRPNGTLLLTVPAITPLDRDDWKDSWYWSFTDASLRRLLSESFANEQIEIAVYGNLNAATAFLHGASAEELGAGRLQPFDPAYPVIVAACAKA